MHCTLRTQLLFHSTFVFLRGLTIFFKLFKNVFETFCFIKRLFGDTTNSFRYGLLFIEMKRKLRNIASEQIVVLKNCRRFWPKILRILCSSLQTCRNRARRSVTASILSSGERKTKYFAWNFSAGHWQQSHYGMHVMPLNRQKILCWSFLIKKMLKFTIKQVYTCRNKSATFLQFLWKKYCMRSPITLWIPLEIVTFCISCFMYTIIGKWRCKKRFFNF